MNFHKASEHLTNFLPFLLVLISVPIPMFKICPKTWGHSHHHEMSYFGADVAQCHLNRKRRKKRECQPLMQTMPKGNSSSSGLTLDPMGRVPGIWERPTVEGLFPCHSNAASSSFTTQPAKNRQTTVFTWKLLKLFHKTIAEVEAESQPAGLCRKHSEFLEMLLLYQFSVSFLKSQAVLGCWGTTIIYIPLLLVKRMWAKTADPDKYKIDCATRTLRSQVIHTSII